MFSNFRFQLPRSPPPASHFQLQLRTHANHALRVWLERETWWRHLRAMDFRDGDFVLAAVREWLRRPLARLMMILEGTNPKRDTRRITDGMEWRRSTVAKVVEGSNRWTKSIGLISNKHKAEGQTLPDEQAKQQAQKARTSQPNNVQKQSVRGWSGGMRGAIE